MLVLVVVALATLSLTSAEPLYWHVGHDIHHNTSDTLTRAAAVDFRGNYGAISILVGPKAAVHPDFAAVSPTQTGSGAATRAWVVEWKREMEPRHLDDMHRHNLPKAHEYQLVHHHGNSWVVVAPEEAIPHDALTWFKLQHANVIPVPTTPVSPRRVPRPSYIKSSGNPNPIIQAAVQQISALDLKASVEFLANHYVTRQSASEGARQAEAWLASEFIKMGFEVTTYPFRSGYSSNVIAELKGTGSSGEIVVVGAHYDSRTTNVNSPTDRAPGADDNGSGTANLLEMARVISEMKLTFQNTIRLIAFGGEEQGLLGSRAYAKDMADKGEKVIAMFNGDMLGWTLPNTQPTLGMKDRLISEWLLGVADGITTMYVPTLPVGRSASCCSDYLSFHENGFDAIGFFENTAGASSYPHYHRSTDLPEYVNFDQVALMSQAIMANTMTFAVPNED